ncbi:phosphate transport system protein [Kineococcus radiotolerans]|uniref:Phosphate-specific transport system accessory protein PhoU n=2 Tax=Kineococcus radiotolerans TaxID=131568 RepID=A6W6E3_KINRD|nr:phosphate signaling complex protein PhoU [Kineococcus radiotolerans]ABS02382.1 phosphate uptake regulator, PhoU [Kineococcus radiotolerans SRS30216 = ATCC BAA-149]MBB2900426.1 phosphate transport system protein [Kineococcus radiotolerans]
MRNVYHDELVGLVDTLVEMTQLAESAMTRATTALLDADRELAETVISADSRIDQLQRDLEERAVDVLARQSPVATDLRVVVTALRMSSSLERMGDLARHVAKLARLRHPEPVVPAELRATVLQMGQVAERIVAKAGSVIATRDVQVAAQIEVDDDEMDQLHRQVFEQLLSRSWDHPTEVAVDLTLCSRYYERFADHAVSVAKSVVFLVTGSREEDVAAQTV